MAEARFTRTDVTRHGYSKEMMYYMKEIHLTEASAEMTQVPELLNKDIKTVIDTIPVSRSEGGR